MIEDSAILDVFTLKQQHESFQQFLHVVEDLGDGTLKAKAVNFEQVDIPQRMLDAKFEQLNAEDIAKSGSTSINP